MGKLTIFASVFALSLVPCYRDVLLMYYTAAGEIRVSGANGKQFSPTNNFNSTETISLAIHYEQDLIFIADRAVAIGGCGGCDTPPENKLSANEGICRQTKNNLPQNVKLYSLKQSGNIGLE
jgi:hypothetical protein